MTQISIVFLLLFANTLCRASNAQYVVSCFESSAYTDGFSVPYHFGIVNDSSKLALEFGKADAERGRYYPLISLKEKVYLTKFKSDSKVDVFVHESQRLSVKLIVDKKKQVVIKKNNGEKRVLDNNFYWSGNLTFNSKVQGRLYKESLQNLVCRHDGMYF